MELTWTLAFRRESAGSHCWACGSTLPPYPSDPPPPMTTPLALFFLLLGGIMLSTVLVDPNGAALASMTTAYVDGRDVSSTMALASAFLGFGGVMLVLTLKQAGHGAVRWICRRCGALLREERQTND